MEPKKESEKLNKAFGEIGQSNSAPIINPISIDETDAFIDEKSKKEYGENLNELIVKTKQQLLRIIKE